MALRCGGGQREICIDWLVWDNTCDIYPPLAPGVLFKIRYKCRVALPRIVKPFESLWELTYDTGGESERDMKFDLAISSTAMAKRLVTSDGRIDFCWWFRWFCRTHLALQTPRKTNVIGEVFNSVYALVWWPCEGVLSFWGTFIGSFWWSAWRSSSLSIFPTGSVLRA